MHIWASLDGESSNQMLRFINLFLFLFSTKICVQKVPILWRYIPSEYRGLQFERREYGMGYGNNSAKIGLKVSTTHARLEATVDYIRKKECRSFYTWRWVKDTENLLATDRWNKCMRVCITFIKCKVVTLVILGWISQFFYTRVSFIPEFWLCRIR